MKYQRSVYISNHLICIGFFGRTTCENIWHCCNNFLSKHFILVLNNITFYFQSFDKKIWISKYVQARKLRLKSCPFDRFISLRFSQWKKMLNKKHSVSITNFSNKTMDMTLLKTFPLLCCLISFVPSTQCLQPKQYNYNIENNVAGKMHSIFFYQGHS